jgi:hypothetical protein
MKKRNIIGGLLAAPVSPVSNSCNTLHFGGFLTISYREIGVKRRKN